MQTLWKLHIQMRNMTQCRRRQPLPEPSVGVLWRYAQSTFSCPCPHETHEGICTHLFSSNYSVLVVQDEVFLLTWKGQDHLFSCSNCCPWFHQRWPAVLICLLLATVPLPHSSTRIFIWLSSELKKIYVANPLRISLGSLITEQIEEQTGKDRKTISCHRLCWKLWRLVSSCQQSPLSPLSHYYWAFCRLLCAKLSTDIWKLTLSQL